MRCRECQRLARPGAWVELRIEATVAEPWHIYGLKEPSGLPTSVTFEPAAGLAAPSGALVETPAPVSKLDPNIGPTLIHEGTIRFTQKVQVAEDAADGANRFLMG